MLGAHGSAQVQRQSKVEGAARSKVIVGESVMPTDMRPGAVPLQLEPGAAPYGNGESRAVPAKKRATTVMCKSLKHEAD